MSILLSLLNQGVRIISKHQKTYASNYVLSNKELETLVAVMMNSKKREYSSFLILMLKELGHNVNKALRIIDTGVNSGKNILPVSLYNFLVTSIKEAVVLSNYKDFIQEDGFISIIEMSRTERFKLAMVDRQTIIRTFRKYNVTYNKR